jgi:hypothetical protein
MITMKRILSVLFLSICTHLSANLISTWTSPVTLSTSGINSSAPYTSMDPNGNVVALWLENDVVVSQSLPLGGSWSASTTLSSTGASDPHIVMDPFGNATAIWVESGVIKTATLPFGSTWSASTALSGSGSLTPKIAVDGSGNLVAVWQTSGAIQSATQVFGSSWSATPDVLASSASAAPTVAISPNGKVIAVWHTLNSVTSLYNVNTSQKTIGGSWSAATTASSTTHNSVYPHAAINNVGEAIAIWYVYSYTAPAYFNVALTGAFYPVSGTWGVAIPISAAGIRNPAELDAKVIINSNNNLVAIWTNSYNDAVISLETATGMFGQLPSSPQVLNQDLFCYNSNMIMDSANDLLTVYMTGQSGSTPISINYIESHAGGFSSGFWSTPVTLSTGNINGFPKLANAVVSGTSIYGSAIWSSFNGTNNVIQATSGTGATVVPPSGLSVVQNVNNFGIFNEYYNTINWTASTDPNLSLYGIYRNGAFLQFILDTSTQFIDSNADQLGSVVYGISAINTTGEESAVITVSYP